MARTHLGPLDMTKKLNARSRPLALGAFGLALFLGGIGWATATGVAIPYQDPTPAMQAYENRHLQITELLMSGGVLLVFVASVWLVVAFARRRRAA